MSKIIEIISIDLQADNRFAGGKFISKLIR